MARRYNPDAFITQTGFVIRWIENRRLECIVKALGPQDGQTVLDLGCGAGNLLERLHAGKVFGVDLSENLLSLARKRLQGRSGFEVLFGDAEHLSFADNTFDGIVCTEVIEHVLHPDVVLAEIYRVAKPGARIVLTFPNESLINWTKRAVLRLGLRKWVAGRYPMSDNMLDEWHLSEISGVWVLERTTQHFRQVKTWHVPFFFLPYHEVIAFDVEK